MENLALWNLAEETQDSIVAHYRPVFNRYSRENSIESRTIGLLIAALTFEPENTTASHLIVRGPYTSADAYIVRLVQAEEKGYLVQVAPGEYRLTGNGSSFIQVLVEDVRALMAEVDPLPSTESRRLASLLKKLVLSCLDTPPPPNLWCIRLSYKLMPPARPSLPFIEQALSCLNAYLDDSHLAAWGSTRQSAAELEVLTLLWRKEAGSLQAILERLDYRGHPPHVYHQAVKSLIDAGLVEGDKSSLRISQAGEQFRQQVEDDTHRNFFQPWSVLSAGEREELAGLLSRLRDGLREKLPE